MAGRVHPKDLGKDRHTSNGDNIFAPAGQSPVVNSDITQKENENLKAYHGLSLGQPSLGETGLPNRPSYGDKGVPVTLWTNNMEVSMSRDHCLFTYEIAIDDRLVIRRKRQFFMESIFRQIPELRALGPGVATDYASLVVTSARVNLGLNDQKTFTLTFYDTELPGDRVMAPPDRPFKLQMSLIGPLSSSDLSRFMGPDLTNSNRSDTADIEAVRALNVIMASHPNKDPSVYQGSRNKFFRYPNQDTFGNYDLEAGLIAVRGFYSSVRFSTSRILLNLNAQCSPFYKVMNARKLVEEFLKSSPGDWPAALESFLSRLRVTTSYMKAPDGTPTLKPRSVVGFAYKTVQISETDKVGGKVKIELLKANEINFQRKEQGPTVSVQEYFLTEYGVTLEHPEGVVVNCGTKKNPVWIPAELCTVMPGQTYRGKLSGSQTARMLTIAARPPAENASRIMAEDGGLGLIGVLPTVSQNLSAFGVKVNPQMITVPGRVLSGPRVTYHGKAKANMRGGASWNMIDRKFMTAATILPWAMLRIGAAARITGPQLQEQYDALTTSFRLCGLESEGAKILPASGPLIPDLKGPDDQSGMNKSFVNSKLRSVFENCEPNGISMLLVILPSNDPWLYDRIKYWSDVKYGVQTICQQVDKFIRSDMMISANIALKVNLKSGGANHSLSPGDLGFLEHGKTMLVGIDVTHPTNNLKGTPSIAGVVASIDDKFNQFPGNIRCQKSWKEMVTDLDVMMEERLELWVSKNINRKLENIVVYRDGVSEGQYKIVLREEVPAIRRACTKIFKDTTQPKITFIIVGKNHHNRLYPTNEKTANRKRNCNVQPGTVVDRGITMPQGWDFFLVAHEPLNGTAKPAHYTVVLDEIKDSKVLGANQLEKITHNLCYLYGRATKVVSICPPAYYAHLICLRARCYISNYVNHNWPVDKVYDENESPWHSGGVHKNLNDSMFYI